MSDRRPAIRLPAALFACALLTLGLHALPSAAAQVPAPPAAVHTYEEFIVGRPGIDQSPTYIGGAYAGYWYYGASATCAAISATTPPCYAIGSGTSILAYDPFTSFEADFYAPQISSLRLVAHHGNGEVTQAWCRMNTLGPTHCRISADDIWQVEIGYYWEVVYFDTAIFTRILPDSVPVPEAGAFSQTVPVPALGLGPITEVTTPSVGSVCVPAFCSDPIDPVTLDTPDTPGIGLTPPLLFTLESSGTSGSLDPGVGEWQTLGPFDVIVGDACPNQQPNPCSIPVSPGGDFAYSLRVTYDAGGGPQTHEVSV